MDWGALIVGHAFALMIAMAVISELMARRRRRAVRAQEEAQEVGNERS